MIFIAILSLIAYLINIINYWCKYTDNKSIMTIFAENIC